MENSRNQLLRPRNQQPQTPIDQTPKKNESNIRLSYINKPKLPLKQLIEECQLKLSAKKEHLRHASKVLLQEHEHILNILDISQAFYNEQAFTLRKNNWIIQLKNRPGILQQKISFIDYSYRHAGSEFKEMGIAQISQNRHNMTNKAINNNEQKVKLLLPHKKKKVVTVEIASISSVPANKDIWMNWDVEDINNNILKQLLESQITIYHNELYNKLINDAQNSYLEKKVKFSENMISIPLNNDKVLIFRIKTKMDNDKPVNIKQLSQQELSQAFIELFLQQKLRNLHKRNIQRNNFFIPNNTETVDQNINILSPSVSTISKSNINIKNEPLINKKSDNDKPKSTILKDNFIEQTYELILYKECIEYIKTKLDYFIKTLISGRIPIAVHFEKIFNDKAENTLENETQILINFFNSYQVKFGIKFPTKVVFYLNRQGKNGLLNCHEVKNGFIKFLLQELKIICLKIICQEANNSGITGNEKWEVDDIVGKYLKGIINFQDRIGVFEVVTHSSIEPLELSFNIKCQFNKTVKEHIIKLNSSSSSGNDQLNDQKNNTMRKNNFNYFPFFINEIQKIFVNDVIMSI